jgi:hypothetical protein
MTPVNITALGSIHLDFLQLNNFLIGQLLYNQKSEHRANKQLN